MIVVFLFVAFTFSYYVFFVASKKNLIEINASDENDLLLNDDDRIHPSQVIEHNLIPPQNPHLDDNTIKEFIVTQKIPPILLDESDNSNDKAITREEFLQASLKQNEKQKMIQEAILHSWKGYHEYAWGQDMLKPITRKGKNWFGIGLTILDSLDTLLIAGLENGSFFCLLFLMQFFIFFSSI